MRILNRIPSLQAISGIFGLISLLVYGWSMYWFVWYFPSWISYLTIGEILTTFYYTMAVNFAESLAVLLFLLLVCIILPSNWMRDEFQFKGGMMVLYFLSFGMTLLGNFIPLEQLARRLIFAIVLFFPVLIILKKVRILQTILTALVDRSVVFLYLTLPISVIALIVIVFRNIIYVP